MVKRTVMRSSKGKKLYAVRNESGEFKDIQSYSRAHAQDIKRGSGAEKKLAKKAVKRKAAKKRAAKRPAAKKTARKTIGRKTTGRKTTARKTAKKRAAKTPMSGAQKAVRAVKRAIKRVTG
ncbi:MAG: hypothetical protein ABI585_15095 [Betaproteobacteria bacterium]